MKQTKTAVRIPQTETVQKIHPVLPIILMQRMRRMPEAKTAVRTAIIKTDCGIRIWRGARKRRPFSSQVIIIAGFS
jgi:hypothetical protein